MLAADVAVVSQWETDDDDEEVGVTVGRAGEEKSKGY